MEGQERVPASSARVRDGVCLRRDRSPKQHRLQRGRCFRAAVRDRAHRLRPSGRRGSGCCMQAATCGCSTLRRPLCPAAAPAMGCSPVCVPLRAVITSCAVLAVCPRAQRPSPPRPWGVRLCACRSVRSSPHRLVSRSVRGRNDLRLTMHGRRVRALLVSRGMRSDVQCTVVGPVCSLCVKSSSMVE